MLFNLFPNTGMQSIVPLMNKLEALWFGVQRVVQDRWVLASKMAGPQLLGKIEHIGAPTWQLVEKRDLGDQTNARLCLGDIWEKLAPDTVYFSEVCAYQVLKSKHLSRTSKMTSWI